MELFNKLEIVGRISKKSELYSNKFIFCTITTYKEDQKKYDYMNLKMVGFNEVAKQIAKLNDYDIIHAFGTLKENNYKGQTYTQFVVEEFEVVDVLQKSNNNNHSESEKDEKVKNPYANRYRHTDDDAPF